MTMRRLLTGSAIAILVAPVSAQSYEWAGALSGPNFMSQVAYATVMDSEGSLITIGTYTSTTDLDPGPGEFNVVSNGDADVFIQKLDAMGNFVWGKSFGGTSTDWARGVAVDSEDNIVLTGRTNGAVDLDPGPGTDIQSTVNTGFDVYVIKLNNNGDYLWGRLFGGLGSDVGYAIAVDASDNIITVGAVGNTADLDPGPGVTNGGGNGSQDIFVQKMSPDGLFIWGFGVGGTQHDIAYGVAVDDAGDIFVSGEFRNVVDFDPGPSNTSRTSGGAEDIFVARYSSGGALVWVNSFGNTGSERAKAIAVGPDGGPVFTGRITSATDFDPGPGTFNLPGSNLEDAFICKLTATGDLAWAFILATFLNEGLGITVDLENNVYATGVFGTFQNNPLDLDPGPGTTHIFNNGGGDVWLASYTGDGNYRWGFGIGGAQNDVSHTVTVGLLGRVAIAGTFRQTMDMDPGPGIANLVASTVSTSNAFVAMYGIRELEGVFVRMNALLEGPYQGGFWPMKDDLRAAGLIPINEPYTAMGFVLDAAASTTSLALSWTLSNAIVDWVLVELRDAADPSVVVARKAGLLRVGTGVVAPDGVSAIGFSNAPGNYHVALRHRNHLGIMTAAPVALTNTPITIDTRDPATPIHGVEARKTVNGTMMLWAGNTVDDGLLKYVGANNDRDAILVQIGGMIPTATTSGYWPEDVNMDGLVKYVGAANDRDPILQNIGGIVPTATRSEQLP